MSDLVASENTIELTPREIVLAQGGDPDEAPESTDTMSVDAGPPEEETVTEDGASTEAADAEAPGELPDGDEEADPAQEADADRGSGGDTEVAWYSAEDLQVAASLGLDEAGLGEYASAEEFARATALLDRNLIAAARREPAEETPPEQLTESQDKKPPETEAGAPPSLDLEKYAGYDEETIALVKHANALQERSAGMEQRLAQVEAAARRAEEQHQAQQRAAISDAFHDATDFLDEGLYGRSLVGGAVVQLPDAVEANRRRLFEETMALRDGIIARAARLGQPAEVPPMRALVKRAEQVVFGPELRARERKAHQDKIAAQSRKRRPVATGARSKSAPVAPAKAAEVDEVAQVSDHPEVVKAWDAMQEESGAS